MPRHPAIFLLLLAALTGCLSVSPPETPEIGTEIPDGWTATPSEATPGGEISRQPGWWKSFGDPRLDALIEEVLAANHDLAAAAARVEAAEAQARIAGADLRPQVAASFDPSRRRQNFIGFPIPGSESGVLSTTTTTYGASLNVSWEADLWGRLKAGKAAAAAALLAGEADLEAARLSLAGQTAKTWFAALEAREQLAFARETADNRRRSRDRIRRRYERGLRSALDLRLAMSTAATAQANVALWQRLDDGAWRQIDLLASRYPSGRRHPGEEESGGELPGPPPGLPALPGSPPAGIPSEILTRRPDLASAELRLAATGLGIQQARAALYPRLSLTGSAGRSSDELGDLLDKNFSVWSLAGRLLQPVFQGGRLRAGVDLAEARYREAAETYLQTVLRAFGEVEGALAAERHLQSQARALAEATEHSAAAQRLAEGRYDAGLTPYLAVLEAQREAVAARTRAAEVQRRLLEARVDLHLALGGGWGGGWTAGATKDGYPSSAASPDAEIEE